ncbi:MAG: hypothetical protein J6A63_00005 [Clostridia bacterium]|nr:hypothetical protein [Clostridia bacterium]
MKNNVFDLIFDSKAGGITSLVFVGDPYQMNFCKPDKAYGTLHGYYAEEYTQANEKIICFSRAKVLAPNENWMCSRREKEGIEIYTEFSFEGENLRITHRITNRHSTPVYFKEGDIAFEMPVYDAYDSSSTCEKSRAHAHIFAGNDCAYVRAERMGESMYNLGVIFTQGRISSYSQYGVESNNRGYFLMNAAPFHLQVGEEEIFSYVCFRYDGGARGFAEKASRFDTFFRVESEKYTYTSGEKVTLSVTAKSDIDTFSVNCKGETLDAVKKDNVLFISFIPKSNGEKKVCFTINGKTSYAKFNVVLPYEDLVERRIRFIVEKQQCMEKNSPLYGAYLIYDNEDETQYFDDNFPDHNACRERYGMALLIARWLQTHEDAQIRDSLNRYVEFILREGYNEETGEVYNCIGRRREPFRLYNILWLTMFFMEMYKLTKSERWLDNMEKSMLFYYENGGANFYPNSISFFEFFDTLLGSGRTCEKCLAYFDEHVENIIFNGSDYPAHEVNFEQVILTAAATILLDKYRLCKQEKYLKEAEKHLRILRKLDGCQPDYHCHDIPIRYWDDYWFGKYGSYGDVFPHYWSTLSGCCYLYHSQCVGDEQEYATAMHNIQNNICLFTEDGRGSCAYLFPRETNGYRAERFNVFANDQDFALYYLLKYCL